MRKFVLIMLGAVAIGASVPQAFAQARATAPEAEAMVRKAVDFYRNNGKDKAFAEFTAPSKSFVDRDLYIVAYSMEGVPLAHGQNAKQVGKNLMELKDPDGKQFVKERVDLAATKGKFWQDYKFTDPLTKQVLPKRMYCEKADEVVICGGIYKE